MSWNFWELRRRIWGDAVAYGAPAAAALPELMWSNIQMTPATMGMHKALNALYIAVEKSIADDVNAKVRARVEELEAALQMARAYVETSLDDGGDGAEQDLQIIDVALGNELNSPQESGSSGAPVARSREHKD